MTRVVHPGSRIQGSKRHRIPDPRSRFATLEVTTFGLISISIPRFANLEPAFDIRVNPHRPDQHPEGTESDLDKILHICLDSQETAKTKIRSCPNLSISRYGWMMEAGNLRRNNAKKSESGAEVSNLSDNIFAIIAEGRRSPRSGWSRRAYVICHLVLAKEESKAFLMSW